MGGAVDIMRNKYQGEDHKIFLKDQTKRVFKAAENLLLKKTH